MFIGRRAELASLEEGFRSSRSEFFVVYGRRRIGKSTLLSEFARGKAAFFYSAGRERKRAQLKRFVQELGAFLADPLAQRVRAAEWSEALELLDRNVEKARRERRSPKWVIILDEFQWMCNGSRELLSDLQRFWDTRWKGAGNIFLVLCGSVVSFMLGEVLSERSPLFGRRTRSLEIGPFTLREAGFFLPGKQRFEIAETYLAVGGIPNYLQLFGERESFRARMEREGFTKDGFLFNEVRFLLSEQLKETARYFLLLHRLAERPMGLAELERATSIGSGQILHYLERLILLGYVSRHVPFGAAPGSKTVRFRIDDYFLRFHFAFIEPARRRIRPGRVPPTFDEGTGRRWDAFAGLAFEQLAAEQAGMWIERLGRRRSIVDLGSYWRRKTLRRPGLQIDLCVETDDRSLLLCECKWSRGRAGMEAVHALREAAALFPNPRRLALRPVLIAASGVTFPPRAAPDVAVVTLEDFFGP